jgi:hypothetical protein
MPDLSEFVMGRSWGMGANTMAFSSRKTFLDKVFYSGQKYKI